MRIFLVGSCPNTAERCSSQPKHAIANCSSTSSCTCRQTATRPRHASQQRVAGAGKIRAAIICAEPHPVVHLATVSPGSYIASSVVSIQCVWRRDGPSGGCYGLCLSDQRDPGPAPQMSRRLSLRRAPGSPLVAPASTSKLRTLVTGPSLSRCEELLRLKSMYSP
jgi:hypothetical protein